MENVFFYPLDKLLSEISRSKYFVCDLKITEIYPIVAQFLADKSVFYLDSPEHSKNFDSFQKGCEYFLSKGITRTDELVCIGGGATLDLGGFIASSLMRGIEWKAVPTTLLSMVDASIGGKVAINSAYGKNLIGAFHNPTSIYIDVDFTKTLLAEEIKSGLGEVVKYEFLFNNIGNFDLSESLVKKCIENKLQVTSEDFKEAGQRKLLNLGHTLGHAIELEYKLPHGIAIFNGIYYLHKLFHKDEIVEIAKDYSVRLGLELINIDLKKLTPYLKHDKKKTGDTITIVLAEDLGHCNLHNIKFDTLIEMLDNA